MIRLFRYLGEHWLTRSMLIGGITAIILSGYILVFPPDAGGLFGFVLLMIAVPVITNYGLGPPGFQDRRR